MGRTRRTMLSVVLSSPRLSSQTGGAHVSGGVEPTRTRGVAAIGAIDVRNCGGTVSLSARGGRAADAPARATSAPWPWWPAPPLSRWAPG
jgi:hypothetical protein